MLALLKVLKIYTWVLVIYNILYVGIINGAEIITVHVGVDGDNII